MPLHKLEWTAFKDRSSSKPCSFVVLVEIYNTYMLDAYVGKDGLELDTELLIEEIETDGVLVFDLLWFITL